MTEVLALPVVLFALVVALECIGKEYLNNPGAKFASGSGDAVASTPITSGEDLSWYLWNVSGATRADWGVPTMNVVTFGPKLKAM